jgi:prepilin-type N-terminal cleavage/methylation domain-containing protein
MSIHHKNKSGFTLIEVIIALAIFVILITAFVPLFVTSVQRIVLAGQKSQYLYELQKDIESEIAANETGTLLDLPLVFLDGSDTYSETVAGREVSADNFNTFLADEESKINYVAVGNGIILTSNNTVTWTPSSVSGVLNSVMWGGPVGYRKYIAVGEHGVIRSSRNGNTWQTESSGITNHLYDIIWDGSVFYAVAINTIVSSTGNGTWSSVDIGLVSGDELYSIAYGGIEPNKLYIIIGKTTDNKTLLFSSPDGQNWVRAEYDEAEGYIFRELIWTNNSFAAIGDNASKGIIRFYDDINTATGSRIFESFMPAGIAVDVNRIFLVGRNSKYAYSTDSGVTWNVSPTSGSIHYRGMTWDGTKFIVVGDSGTLYTLTSPSGTWQLRTTNTLARINAVISRYY